MQVLFALLFMLVAIPPAPHAYVTDNVHALSPQANAQITQELTAYEKATGHRVIVWVGQSTGDTPLEDWTIHAAEQWKVFKTKGRDDGAILFVFMGDHKVRIEVGYGLEGTLTDAAASGIIRHTIVPKMRAGDTDGAIRDGVDRMLLTITPSFAGSVGHPVTNEGNSGESSRDVIAFIILIGIFIGAFILIGAASSKRRGRKGWIFGSGYSPWVGSFGGFSGGSSGGGFGGGFSGGFGGGGASGGW